MKILARFIYVGTVIFISSVLFSCSEESTTGATEAKAPIQVSEKADLAVPKANSQADADKDIRQRPRKAVDPDSYLLGGIILDWSGTDSGLETVADQRAA